jgi:hypothetical protein
MIGNEVDLEKHIKDQIDNKAADQTCWGLMRVGGPAWEDYEFKGVHPMSTLMSRMEELCVELGVKAWLRVIQEDYGENG